MKVKICGIFEERTLMELRQQGVWPDYIGFVFAKSKRQVALKQVKEWLHYIPKNIVTVGVFVNPELKELIDLPVDIIQLHGEESPYFCKLIKDITGKKVWKAIPVKHDKPLLSYEIYEKFVDGYIFDTAGAARGGNGIRFNWELHKDLWQQIKKPVLIAGGINHADIAKLGSFAINGIDLSSGVEVEGLKSAEKIIEIINGTRG